MALPVCHLSLVRNKMHHREFLYKVHRGPFEMSGNVFNAVVT